MKKKLITSLTGAIVAGALIVGSAGPAHAADFSYVTALNGGSYAAFQFEGNYPSKTPCWRGSKGYPRFRAIRTATYDYNHTPISVKYYYSRGCGSYARIDKAPLGCYAVLYRAQGGDPNGPRVAIYEAVEDGIDYAYTKVGNNLQGRVSWAALFCDDDMTGTYHATRPF